MTKYRIIFHTQSRNCPMRHLNGEEVLVEVDDRVFASIGRRLPRFLVRLKNPVFGVPWTTTVWIAYPDELFLEPS